MGCGYAGVLLLFIKLLFVTNSPRFVAGVYTGMAGIGAIVAVAAGWVSLPMALLLLVLRGAVAFGYFWSLFNLRPWTGTWWAVVVGGALVMAAINGRDALGRTRKEMR